MINEIAALDLVEQYLNGTQAEQAEILQVCGRNAAKKIEAIQTKYLSNPDFRDAFQKTVIALV